MFKKSASPEKKTQLGGEIAGQFSRAEEMTEKQCITTEQHCWYMSVRGPPGFTLTRLVNCAVQLDVEMSRT